MKPGSTGKVTIEQTSGVTTYQNRRIHDNVSTYVYAPTSRINQSRTRVGLMLTCSFFLLLLCTCVILYTKLHYRHTYSYMCKLTYNLLPTSFHITNPSLTQPPTSLLLTSSPTPHAPIHLPLESKRKRITQNTSIPTLTYPPGAPAGNQRTESTNERTGGGERAGRVRKSK